MLPAISPAVAAVYETPPRPARSGKLGAVADEIDELQRKVAQLERDANAAWQEMTARAGNLAPDAALEAEIARGLRDRYLGEIERVKKQIGYAQERRRDVLEDRKRWQSALDASRAYIAENEQRSAIYEAAMALFDQALQLDPNDWKLREAVRFGKGEICTLPNNLAQARATIKQAEHMLEHEIGNE